VVVVGVSAEALAVTLVAVLAVMVQGEEVAEISRFQYLQAFQYPQAGRERILAPTASPKGKYTYQILMSQVEMH